MNPHIYQSYFLEGLKKRLGIKNSDFNKYEDLLIKAIVDHNQTIVDLLAIPEQDDFVYYSSDNNQTITKPMYSSSTFVAALWKAAGMFGKLNVNAQEFSLRDIYQVDFFDKKKSHRPSKCKDADPKIPYCQLMGDFRIQLAGFSSVKPYANMNEKCPSMLFDYGNVEKPYNYNRTEGC